MHEGSLLRPLVTKENEQHLMKGVRFHYYQYSTAPILVKEAGGLNLFSLVDNKSDILNNLERGLRVAEGVKVVELYVTIGNDVLYVKTDFPFNRVMNGDLQLRTCDLSLLSIKVDKDSKSVFDAPLGFTKELLEISDELSLSVWSELTLNLETGTLSFQSKFPPSVYPVGIAGKPSDPSRTDEFHAAMEKIKHLPISAGLTLNAKASYIDKTHSSLRATYNDAAAPY